MVQKRSPDSSEKTRRKPKKGHSYGRAGSQEWVFFSNQSPTSPQFILNNSVEISSDVTSAWSYAGSYSTSQTSISIGTNYWVDLVGIFCSANSAAISYLSINGSVIDPIPQSYDDANLTFDVYGYGLSGSVQVNSTQDLYIGPMVPETIVNTKGTVVFPPALESESVKRDL